MARASASTEGGETPFVLDVTEGDPCRREEPPRRARAEPDARAD